MRILLAICVALVFTQYASAIDPPPAAMKLIEEFKAKEKASKDKLEAEIAALRVKATQETENAKKQLIAELDKVRIALEKEEQHNEARAVAARIRSIFAPPVSAAAAPTNMTAYAANLANFDKSFIFRITGRHEGGHVWGVGPYTSDSDLARAAVHSGVLAADQTGFIKVTLVSTAGTDFAGSNQNGVVTSAYTSWPAGYRLERVTSEEAEGVIEAEDPVAPAGISEDAESRSSTTGVLSGFIPASGAAPTVERLGPRSTFRPMPKR